jgi:hypothetical protein
MSKVYFDFIAHICCTKNCVFVSIRIYDVRFYILLCRNKDAEFGFYFHKNYYAVMHKLVTRFTIKRMEILEIVNLFLPVIKQVL